jgi:hypothetical protein
MVNPWNFANRKSEMLELEGKLIRPATYLQLQRYRQKWVVRKLRAGEKVEDEATKSNDSNSVSKQQWFPVVSWVHQALFMGCPIKIQRTYCRNGDVFPP